MQLDDLATVDRLRGRDPKSLCGITESLKLRPATTGNHTFERLACKFLCRHHNKGVACHHPHQVMELGFNRGKIRKDVSVIKFKIIEHRYLRSIMHKL